MNKTKPCNRVCNRYLFDECDKCQFNENQNPLAKQTREQEEKERTAWAGQQGAL